MGEPNGDEFWPPDAGDDYEETVECWDCGGEMYTHHDCGEDTCCCLDPEDNVRCETCGGKGFLVVGEPSASPSTGKAPRGDRG